MNRSTMLLIVGAGVALLLLNRRASAATAPVRSASGDHVSPSNPRQWLPDFSDFEGSTDRANASVRANNQAVWYTPDDVRRYLPDGDLTGFAPSRNVNANAATRGSALLQLFAMSEPATEARGAQPPSLITGDATSTAVQYGPDLSIQA